MNSNTNSSTTEQSSPKADDRWTITETEDGFDSVLCVIWADAVSDALIEAIEAIKDAHERWGGSRRVGKAVVISETEARVVVGGRPYSITRGAPWADPADDIQPEA